MDNTNGTAFFPSLWGVCCGTRIFRALRGNSIPRTVWHLVLMSLFCAGLITLGGVRRATSEWEVGLRRFEAEFGNRIVFSPQGMRPALSPEKPRFIALPGDGGLFYAAGEDTVRFPAGFISGAVYFTVWSDCCVAVGVRTAPPGGDDDWLVRVIRPDQSFSVHRVGDDGLSALLSANIARLRARGGSWKLPRFEVGTDELFRFFKKLTAAAVFVSEFFGILMLGVSCTALFALISRFTGAAALRGLNGWEYWKIGVYAGFPGMLVGSIAEALELPYLAYGVVYSLALVVYWLPASLACAEVAADEEDGSPRT